MPVLEGEQARVPERQEPEGEREVCQVLLQGEGPQGDHRREGREDADVLHGVYLPTGKVHLSLLSQFHYNWCDFSSLGPLVPEALLARRNPLSLLCGHCPQETPDLPLVSLGKGGRQGKLGHKPPFYQQTLTDVLCRRRQRHTLGS